MDMKRATLVVALLLMLTFVTSVLSQGSKSGHCPLARTVTNCMNRCKSDYDCSFSKKCCPNSCGSTSCADTSPVSTGTGERDNPRNSAYCGNVKCHSGEKCVLDKTTKRQKCVRG
ncbi:waprin-Thr1 [Periplaneta americana]|uniref:waprin-Thr1 n=1 Tax=Periplaneta americana TaxID=6978 RepID=UPI0037E7BC5B